MNAIILAAGMGLRLKPLTDEIPKPLLPVIDRPVVDIIIERLKDAGVKRIGINLFYRHSMVTEHLAGMKNMEIIVEKSLTDTGGPLLCFARLWSGDVIIHNCDILADFDLAPALEHHHRNRALATLILTRNKGTNLVQTRLGRVVAFHRRERPGFQTYAGIAIYNRNIGDFFPKNKKAFSIKEVLTAAIKAGKIINGLPIPGVWRDIGGPRAYWQIHNDLLKGRIKLPGVTTVAGGKYIDPSSRIETEHIAGFCSIGPNCYIGPNVHLENSIVLPNTLMKYGNYRSAIISSKFCLPVK
jgi:NDP-sugar pyrophosphorylase family protein